MGGIVNGIAYHGGFIPYAGTFLTFSDYMRGVRFGWPRCRAPRRLRLDPRLGRARRGRPDPPAGRALRRPPGDPEPVVHPARATPTRPRAAWAVAVERRDGPVALALTRQKLTTLPETAALARDGVGPRRLRPARVAAAGRRAIDLILVGTGSELQLAVGGRRRARGRGHPDPGRLAPVLGAVRRASRRPTARRPAAGDPPAGDASRRASRSAGSAMPATRARSSGSTTSGRRPRPATILEHFGFTAERVADVGRRVVRDGLRGRVPTARPRPPAGRLLGHRTRTPSRSRCGS